MPSILDIAKLNLEASKAAVQARVDLMKAFSDFNHRMAEAAKVQAEAMAQQILNAQQMVKLRQLKDALQDFMNARRACMKAETKAANELKRVELNARKMPSLLLGETLPADDVAPAWRGLEFFVKAADAPTLTKVTALKAPASALKGVHFSKNRTPDKPCDDPPTSISHAWPLLVWARGHLFIPRIGSPPQMLLGKVIEALADGAERIRSEVEDELEAARADLKEIRSASLRTLDIGQLQPKEPEQKP